MVSGQNREPPAQAAQSGHEPVGKSRKTARFDDRFCGVRVARWDGQRWSFHPSRPVGFRLGPSATRIFCGVPRRAATPAFRKARLSGRWRFAFRGGVINLIKKGATQYKRMWVCLRDQSDRSPLPHAELEIGRCDHVSKNLQKPDAIMDMSTRRDDFCSLQKEQLRCRFRAELDPMTRCCGHSFFGPVRSLHPRGTVQRTWVRPAKPGDQKITQSVKCIATAAHRGMRIVAP